VAAKKANQFSCSNCGAQFSAWSGRCNVCGEWNTLVEEAVIVTAKGAKSSAGKALVAENIKDIIKNDNVKRMQTGIRDVDNVLGGGFVAGSVSLLAGQPGIGKSTLLLQIVAGLAKNNKVLYVSGEESARQVALRADRLGATDEKIQIVSTINVEDVARTMVDGKYDFVVVDSIQTLTSEAVASVAGSVSQITNCAHMIINIAKEISTAVVMVGHVTKEGSIAGPKVLEHVVDTVLQLEGDRYGGFKILRAVKNRFGSTDEAGIFEMVESGLAQVDNPSEALLSERQNTDGSIVLATMEGNRPVLVEVQALVNKTAYGYPKRAASGIDLNRLNLLIAMLERRTKLNLSDKDVYINIVGGLKITDPGIDLAVCMAIGSADKGLKLKEGVVVYGEVGLSGEIRHVPFALKRLNEAKKLGFSEAIGPKVKENVKNTILKPVSDVRTALNNYLKI
jgi:DNA repair protein RadA/Sms